MDDSTSHPSEKLARAFELVVSYKQTSDPESEEAFLERHEDLRALLLPMLRKVRSLESATFTGSGAVVETEPSFERIGPYRVLHELGRGGQAIVYLAEDRRLQRKIALKVLTGMAVRSPAMRIRLQREAAAASKLDHPGICSVHEIGEDGGVPYIAMRYVEGKTLAEVLAEARAVDAPESDAGDAAKGGDAKADSNRGASRVRRLEKHGAIDEAVSLVERLARALHVAHETGLVHRDIKPRNIMVTPAGEPVLLDFGLAHDQTTDAQSVTQTGQLVGTPAYLAPEQLAIRPVPVDRRADVYALGVTLYECLTLRLPFQMPTREQLYQKILVSDAPDPRRFNPAITHDLKAILETALEKDRDRRYQTALDLAEDLRRFRSFEPVRARSAGPILRLRRWAQRNRALATALTAVFLLLASGLVVSLLLLAESSREQRRAEVNFQMAVDAVEQMLTEVGLSEESLAGLPDLDETRRKLLQRALTFYRRFLKDHHDDPRVRRATARAHHRVAHFHLLLGQFAEAQKENAKALAWCREVIAAAPEDVAVGQDLVRFTKEHAAILYASGKYGEAIVMLERSLAAARDLAARAPRRHELVGLLADCQAELGELAAFTGDTDRAKASLREAIEKLDPLVAAHPDRPSYRFTLAVACRRYARVIRFSDPARQAGPLVRSLLLLDELTARHPNTSRYALERAVTMLSLGLLEMSRDQGKADELLVKAVDTLERLRARHPEQIAIRLQLADGQLCRAQILFDAGRREEAESLLKKAEVLAQGLGSELEGSPQRIGKLIDTYRALAQCLHARRRAIEARQYDERALALAKAHSVAAEDGPMLWKLSSIYSASGFRLAQVGEPEAAEKRLLKAIAIQEKLTSTHPAWIGMQDDFAMSLNKLASIYLASKRADDADALFKRSLAIRRELARRCPESAYVLSKLGGLLHNVAAQHVRRRELPEARGLLEEAIEVQHAAHERAPRFLAARYFLREHLRSYAGVLLDLGDYPGAAEAAEDLARHLPDSPEARFAVSLLLAGLSALTDEGADQSEAYAEQAVVHLARAEALGFRDLDRIRKHEWFRRLGKRDAFQRVLKKMARGEK